MQERSPFRQFKLILKQNQINIWVPQFSDWQGNQCSPLRTGQGWTVVTSLFSSRTVSMTTRLEVGSRQSVADDRGFQSWRLVFGMHFVRFSRILFHVKSRGKNFFLFLRSNAQKYDQSVEFGQAKSSCVLYFWKYRKLYYSVMFILIIIIIIIII